MNSFDLIEKISFIDLIKSLLRKESNVAALLNSHLGISNTWHAYTFDWGRNALYALFKNLPYKIIHFPAYTCPVLTGAARAANKQVVLIDVDPATYNLDISLLAGKKIECMVAVHTFGNPVDIKKIRKMLPNTYIVEDCAHALFSKIGDEYVGSQGDAVLFSFYKQTANFNGGLLLTKTSLKLPKQEITIPGIWPDVLLKLDGWHHVLIDKIRQQQPGKMPVPTYDDRYYAHPWTLSLFTFGVTQLDQQMQKRQQIASWYCEALEHNPYFVPQQVVPSMQSSWYQFPVTVKPLYKKHRHKLVLSLRRQALFIASMWEDAPIIETDYKQWQPSCPRALELAQTVITLPVQAQMNKDAVKKFVTNMTKTMEEFI